MKLVDQFSFFTLIITFLSVLLVGFWELYPYKTIKFNITPLPILNENKTVKSGGYLQIKLDFCKYTKTIPMISRTFADGILYEIPEFLAFSKKIGCDDTLLQIYIPKALPPDEYVLKSTYRYQVNPLRSIDVSVETEQFTIIK